MAFFIQAHATKATRTAQGKVGGRDGGSLGKFVSVVIGPVCLKLGFKFQTSFNLDVDSLNVQSHSDGHHL